MQVSEALKTEIKQMIIDSLALEDISVADIDSAAPLFNEGLGLDSIDALELGIALKKNYQIDIKGKDEETIKKSFYSVDSLAELIASAS